MRSPLPALNPRLVLVAAACLAAVPGLAQPAAAPPQQPAANAAPLDAALRAAIDRKVREALATSGAPSASLAVVRDGRIAYVQAYGDARLEPRLPATPARRYPIGSVSKQFTAAALLLLAEQGKLSLDDTVARWLPELTRARDVTVRQLLSMTAGYQDYWPQDYVSTRMREPVSTDELLARWARIPLDFEPGTRWQYSNTNYVIAGLIAERAGGKPLFQQLQERVFGPLGMTSVVHYSGAGPGPEDAAGYTRYALGPVRPAPLEGKGWLFAAGDLAMTAEDLARWDVALIQRKVLSAASFRELEREVLLQSGVGARYGLGVSVALSQGRRSVSHNGAVSGFAANNVVLPEEGMAVAVLFNLDYSPAMFDVSPAVQKLLRTSAAAETERAVALARTVYADLRRGRVDRTLLSPNADAYFTAEVLKDHATSLAPLGKPLDVTHVSQSLRGGMTVRSLRLRFARRSLNVTMLELPDGRLEQFLLAPVAG